MTDVAAGRRARGGGGSARRAERTAVSFDVAKYIARNIPNFEILNEEALAIIEWNADTVLEEIGVNFLENPGALDLWRAAGRGCARRTCAHSRVVWPASCVDRLRRSSPSTPATPRAMSKSAGAIWCLAPVYGPPFVRDVEGGRRYATMADFNNFVKLGYMSKWLHHSGGTVCEPTDMAVNKRHLDMLLRPHDVERQALHGVRHRTCARGCDSVEMSKLLFGADFVDQNTVMTSLININSPLTFDSTMMGALEVYAKANQAAIISPFIVGGAMAPVTVAGTLTQVSGRSAGRGGLQPVDPPRCAGDLRGLRDHIDMNSGAPTFGTPEAAHITYGAGQLARRMNLPYRSGGSLLRVETARCAGGL